MYTATVTVYDEPEPTTDHVWSHERYRDACADAHSATRAYYAAEHDLSEADDSLLDLCLERLNEATFGPLRLTLTLPGTPRVVVTIDRDPAYAWYPRGWEAAS
jgi:hypothetical protein